jgi:hypothetical protein
VLGDGALAVVWKLGDGSDLTLYVNLASKPVAIPGPPVGTLLHCEPRDVGAALAAGQLPAFAAACYLAPGGA